MSVELGALLLFILTSCASWLVVRFLIPVLRQKDIVDRPNDRTLHQGAIPRGGGLVIALVIVLGALLVGVRSDRMPLFLALSGVMACWAVLSWYDDQRDLSTKFRLAIQLLLSGFTIAAFGWVEQIHGFELGWFGLLLTFVGVLWLTNLYNFMDGMDGLAASQSIIAALTLAFWFYVAGDSDLAVLCVLVAGACYGFLLWNWRPAKVFMGDVGSITLGAFFATLIIIGVTRHGFSVISLVLLFAVFVGDASATILRRLWHREKIWLPHKTHYYQRLANVGVSHKVIVCCAIVMMCLCSLLATLSVVYRDMIGVAIIGAVSLLLLGTFAVVILESRARRG